MPGIEIWIEGRGWVRIDPDRGGCLPRESSADSRMRSRPERGPAAGDSRISWVSDLRLRLDALGQMWRARILRFDQVSQDRLLAKLGIPEPDGQKVVMVMTAALALAFVWLTWQVRRDLRPAVKDPVARANQACAEKWRTSVCRAALMRRRSLR